MAEKMRNNRTGDESEKKQPRKRSRWNRFLLFFLTLLVVLGIVMVAAYRDGTGFDVLQRFFSYGSVEETGGEVIYDYDAAPDNRFVMLGDTLVVQSGRELRVLNRQGEEVWAADVSMKAPALVQGGDRAVAYDVGGTELYVVNAHGELFHFSADEEEPLIAATLNQNGWLAVTAEKKNYKGSVTVYDRDLDRVFAFHSSSRFVTDAYVAEDNKHLAAVTLGQENSVFVSNVVLYDLSKTDPVADYDVENGLVAAIGQQDEHLVTVSDTCLTFADIDGTVSATYTYKDPYLRGYDLNGDGFAALLLNRYQTGSVGRLVTVGTDGAELASLDVDQEILDISAAGRYLGVLYANRLVVYNPDLQVYASLSGAELAAGIRMRSDGSAVLLGAESAGLFLP